MLAKIHPISRAYVNPKFTYTVPNREDVAKIARLDLAQPHTDARLGHSVADPSEPLGKRLSSVFALITKQFGHVELL